MSEEIKTPKKTSSTSKKTVSKTTIIQPQETNNDKIGAVLYHERLKKELSLEEVSQILCIRKSYLEAIEKGNYSELPPMPYSAGFVNGYAKFLGLNNTRVTQLFREEINAKPNDAKSYINEETPAEASLPNKIYVISGIVAVILLALLWGVLSSDNNEEAIVEENIIEEEVVDETTNTNAEVEYFVKEETPVSEKATEETKELQKIEPVSDNKVEEEVVQEEKKISENPVVKNGIEIRITKEDTWFEVKDDKKIYANRILKVGENYILPKREGLILSVGKFDGVEVYVNGELTPVVKPNKKTNINIDNVLKTNH
ncbi:MAG: DUF4115 domain-containing protein [Alphaproteobacteria bacterium]|nr:DUF4115 domain-containing protein [Alphaproteobacteria bacterium]